jgi:putative FmdB family regulatory protein
MPTYEYRCARCDQHLEVYQSFSEAPLTKHKGCGGRLTKVLSPAGIVLKGSGFYKTDSRGGKKGASKDAAPGTKTGTDTGSGSAAGSSGSSASGGDAKSGSSASGGEAKSA